MSEFIEQSMRTLKLGGMAREWRSVQYENTEQYVTDLLRLELREREANRINRMVKTAGFRVMKTLDDFIWNNAIELPKGLTREYMEGLSFLPQRENLIFMGTVGTGKTHLATAIALKACQEGHRVRFFTAASLANILLEKNNKGTKLCFILSKLRLHLCECFTKPRHSAGAVKHHQIHFIVCEIHHSISLSGWLLEGLRGDVSKTSISFSCSRTEGLSSVAGALPLLMTPSNIP